MSKVRHPAQSSLEGYLPFLRTIAILSVVGLISVSASMELAAANFINPAQLPLQLPYAAPFPNQRTAASSTGAGTVAFGSSVGTVGPVTPSPPIAGFSLPFGLFSFSITGLLPGQTVSFQVVAPSPFPTGATAWIKVCPGGVIRIIIASIVSGNVMMVPLTDGDANSDCDGLANGVIVDPGGPGGVSGIPEYPAEPIIALIGSLTIFFMIRRRVRFGRNRISLGH